MTIPFPLLNQKAQRQIVFIHSAGAQGPNEGSDGLTRHLKNELGESHRILNPIMPNPDYPEYKTWKRRLRAILPTVNDGVILIGHSLGGSVLLKYLSEEPFDKKIEGLFLIAAPYWGAKDWEIEEFTLADDFTARLPPIARVFLYHSQNDDIAPATHLELYRKQFPTAVVRIFGGNDHSFERGIPELIDDIKNL